jgi:hypothetical protein
MFDQNVNESPSMLAAHPHSSRGYCESVLQASKEKIIVSDLLSIAFMACCNHSSWCFMFTLDEQKGHEEDRTKDCRPLQHCLDVVREPFASIKRGDNRDDPPLEVKLTSSSDGTITY